MIEAGVAREKCWIALPAQQDDDLLVLQTLATEINSDLPRGQPPGFETHQLSVKNVLVQNDQT